MTDKEKALCLMTLVKRKLKEKQDELIRQSGKLASIGVRKVEWLRYNVDDFNYGVVAYDRKIERQEKIYNDSKKDMNDWKDIQEYCYEKFIKEGV